MTQSIRAGKAVGGQGLYVQTRLVDAANASNVADLTLAGSTLLAVSNPGGRRQPRDRRAGAALGGLRHHPGLRQRGDDSVPDERRAGAVQRHADDDPDRRTGFNDHAEQRAPERARRLAAAKRT